IGASRGMPSSAGWAAGVGFAVPIDPIRWIVPQLIRHGKVERIGMGISIWDDQVPVRLGLEGVLVRQVVKESPAAAAGIRPTEFENSRPTRPGDLIVGVNG